MRFLIILLPLFTLFVLPQFTSTRSTPDIQISQTSPSPQPTPTLSLYPPTIEFKQRITKKSFGTYVNPDSSPVSPEVFIGYHTAVDIEFTDTPEDVPVHAITSGTVAYSGWVAGYGGITIIKHSIDNNQYYVVYGHLRTSGLLPIGNQVTPNQIIGYLGEGYSRDTDNERKHLHFGIPKSQNLEFLGYVQKPEDLSYWIDPLTWY